MVKVKKSRVVMQEDDKLWMARRDARTLSEANVIAADKKRLADAQKEARKLADERIKEAKAMEMVAAKEKKPAETMADYAKKRLGD